MKHKTIKIYYSKKEIFHMDCDVFMPYYYTPSLPGFKGITMMEVIGMYYVAHPQKPFSIKDMTGAGFDYTYNDKLRDFTYSAA